MNNELKPDSNLTQWYQNKIKGGVAEAACKAHFEALGYVVFIEAKYCTEVVLEDFIKNGAFSARLVTY